MKIEYIVYNSNSGFTRKYAEMLSQETGIECVELAQAKGKVKKGASVIFMGWLMAGIVKGYKTARKGFDIKALVAVGMATPTPELTEKTAKQYKGDKSSFFLLQGGFDIKRLDGAYKFMMKYMAKGIVEKLSIKANLTDEEQLMLEMAQNGKDCTSFDALKPMVQLISK